MPVDSTALTRLSRARRTLRRGVLRRRRGLSAILVAAAVILGVRAVASPAPPAETVWVATRDLPAGHALAAGDVAEKSLPRGAAPTGVPDQQPIGEILAAPMRAGEPVTDVRLWGEELLSAYDGRVAVPVRLPDPAAVELLEPGDTLDLWASDPQGGDTELVVTEARVMTVPPSSQEVAASGLTGRLVVMAVEPDEVADVTHASAQRFLSFTFGSIQ